MNELSTLLFCGLLAHFIGDYWLQNDIIAKEKVNSDWYAIIHVTLYAIPFYFIVNLSPWLAIIMTTHFFIDRFRLVNYWIKLINWDWSESRTQKTWLVIVYDNILHVCINSWMIYCYYVNL